MSDSVEYMPIRSYSDLDEMAFWNREVTYHADMLRDATNRMFPDSSREPIKRAEFEDIVNAFEHAQKNYIRTLDALLP